MHVPIIDSAGTTVEVVEIADSRRLSRWEWYTLERYGKAVEGNDLRGIGALVGVPMGLLVSVVAMMFALPATAVVAVGLVTGAISAGGIVLLDRMVLTTLSFMARNPEFRFGNERQLQSLIA